MWRKETNNRNSLALNPKLNQNQMSVCFNNCKPLKSMKGLNLLLQHFWLSCSIKYADKLYEEFSKIEQKLKVMND